MSAFCAAVAKHLSSLHGNMDEKMMMMMKTMMMITLISVISGGKMITTMDCGPGGPWFKWVPIFYEGRSTAQGLPTASSL